MHCKLGEEIPQKHPTYSSHISINFGMACPAVPTLQQRVYWAHQPHDAVATDTEDIHSDGKEIVIPPLIYPEEFDNDEDHLHEYLSNPPSADPTSEPGPPREKPTKEVTSEPDSDALSQPSETTRGGSMGHISPGDNFRQQKGPDLPRFSTLEDFTKEASWGYT